MSPDGEVLEIAHARLRPVVDAVVEMLDPLLQDGDLKTQVQIHPNADWARFDRVRLEQILTNLFGNAFLYEFPQRHFKIFTGMARS